MQIKLPTLGLFAALALQTHATGFIATNTYIITEGQVVAEEQWVAAGIAETEGTFKDDLFISSGGQLVLNGSYEGNIWGAAGGIANMGGRCGRNVRLAGKSVRIDGPVDGNVMAMAETIIATTNAVIAGHARLIGSSVIFEGNIQGDVSISAARIVTLGGSIGGNVKVVAPDILFSRGTHIAGDFSYTANKELVPAEGVVAGNLERVVPQSPPPFSMDRLTSRTMWFLAAFLAGVPFIALFPMTTAMASQLVRKSPWKCLMAGFLASIALPLFGMMCASSIIGIPLGALTLAGWGIMFYLSRIIMGLVLGTLILRTIGTSIGRVLLAMALGLAIIYLATMVPSIGVPVQLTVVWMGMGALILALLQKRRLIIQAPEELKQLEELKKQTITEKPEDK